MRDTAMNRVGLQVSENKKWLAAIGGSATVTIVVCVLIQLIRPFDANTWTAVGTVILAYSTTALFIVAGYQLLSVRQQIKISFDDNRMNRTLDACNKYDFDPLLDRALRALKSMKDDKSSDYYKDSAITLKSDVLTIINYLDSIAIGIEQNIYIEDLAKDHLKEILIAHCRSYLIEPNAARFGINAGNFSRLKRLYDRWVDPGTTFSNGKKGKEKP